MAADVTLSGEQCTAVLDRVAHFGAAGQAPARKRRRLTIGVTM